ncbi:MAG TPA: hypothetical protein V6C90_13475 [Coleofasciculaceae cyanobacterium]
MTRVFGINLEAILFQSHCQESLPHYPNAINLVSTLLLSANAIASLFPNTTCCTIAYGFTRS